MATYTYDGNGLRVKKLSGSTTTVYIFSGSKVIAEYDNGAAPGAPSREYIYSGSALVATVAGSVTTYHHPDHLSVRLSTDAAGSLTPVRTFGHYPYGEVWYETGTASKLKFTSYERDSESGNDYAMMRSYVNRLARFSSPDPLSGSTSRPQSLNRYAYVRNDPINLSDPSGRMPRMYVCGGSGDPVQISGCFWWGGIGGGGGGGGGNLIMGNNIFDAIVGQPGTYLSLDMYGNLSWGFSIDLYNQTWNFIDRERSTKGLTVLASNNPHIQYTIPPLYPEMTGYQVLVHDFGTGSLISGFIPDLLAAVQNQLQEEGPPPVAPASLEKAIGLFNSQVKNGTDPNVAWAIAMTVFPEVRDYISDFQDYLNSLQQNVQPVITAYPGIFGR